MIIKSRLISFTRKNAKEFIRNITPALTAEKAQRMMKQTEDAYILTARFGSPSFDGLKNVNGKTALAYSGAVLPMRDLLDIGYTLRAIRKLRAWYDMCSGTENCLKTYFDSLSPDRALEERIFSCIISEEEMADDASGTLKSIRRDIKAKEAKIRVMLDRIIRSPNYQTVLRDPIVTMRNGRFVVPVKYECRSQIAGLVQDTSSSGSTVFIEPMSVVDANNDIRVLAGQEADEIERILSELSAAAGNESQSLKHSWECALQLDVIFAKAQLAYDMDASVPKITDDGIIKIRKARHPLIDKNKAVASDIILGDTYDTLVITGPNTGGKTVSIKTAGLLTLMAASGLMIPAGDGSSVSVFNNVYADIGDEQSIEQSLSTFSSHMVNIIDIMSKTDGKTLILIDELGAGTDPVEGAALAMAILERLKEKGAKIAATTHYAELKEYALSADRVENACCEFDVKTLRPTYRLLIGVPGRSNAFAVSEKLGLESSVIKRAQELTDTSGDRLDKAVSKLEDSRVKMEDSAKKAEADELSAREARQKAEQLLSSVESDKEKELENARGEALRIIEKAKREAYAFMDDLDKLKKQKKNSDSLSQLSADAKKNIKSHIGNLDEIANPVVERAQDENYVLPRDLVIGDRVIISSVGTDAVVAGLPDKKGDVEVTSGIMKMRVPLSDLRLDTSKKKQKTAERSRHSVTSKAEMNISTEIDLRGMTADEAELSLDRFIDMQMRSGINQFTVIHGKGTGVLRKTVSSYLSKCRYVKEYRLGTFGEGEDGVTIVTLK